MKNRLLLIRHGENYANLTLEFSYRLVDYSLTPKGILQAQQTANALSGERINAVYTSPLKRAAETAEIIAAPHNLPVTVIEEFRELNVGELENCRPTATLWDEFNAVITAWNEGNPRAAFPGGEDHLSLVARARQAFEQVLRGNEGQTLLIVAHGGIFLYTLPYIFRGIGPAALQGGIPNCSITEIEAWMEADGLHGQMARYASTDHLNGEAARLVSGVPQAGKPLPGER